MNRDRAHPPLPENPEHSEGPQLSQRRSIHHRETPSVANPSAVPTIERPFLEEFDGQPSSARNPASPIDDRSPITRVATPPPVRSREGGQGRPDPSRRLTTASQSMAGVADWIVPVDKRATPELTISERLKPTLEAAEQEKQKYSRKAMLNGYALNVAIGLQVLLGSLTTGLSVVTSGRQTSIMTTILGGMATLVASYLARARGSHEPELSITRVKDLEQFIRDCKSFQMDHGHQYGSSDANLHQRVIDLRGNFEELLGNGNGERKMSPV
ncbi:hypothetical protein BJ138DRAFT_1146750 [Hygrophoropsis aurantiaca]|uniref:Uncharacterized protein n=1 Tax=Hygrophoropsis aurantiaca TaxID=72124 RepID=A0ACB8AII3_9AGAM|nr:hypothetical protein BJ138DRAFT_1146750 [Hygrophoropsis aurantiaca]